MLHLAGHGQANQLAGDSCFLVFASPSGAPEAGRLFACDIQSLQLRTELVTLSACETGVGEWRPGEGPISLAHAFAFAGAQNVVTSLWSVSDAKTKDLMLDFYTRIALGTPQVEALRDAQLNFLYHHKGQWAHPFYWAGFVLIESNQ